MSESTASSSASAPAGSVGVVEPRTVRLDKPLQLVEGSVLPYVDVTYETLGELDAARSNAILICHAWTGDAHVAGYRPGEDPSDPDTKPGWWDHYVGPGKAVDTRRYFVICNNLLGGCRGTTGPTSINPQTGKPWGPDFPVITVTDMVEVQRRLIDHLGIDRLLCVVGGSLGGMLVLEWTVAHPDRVYGALPIATTPSLGPQALAFNSVGRHAIRTDPDFHDGRYAERGVRPRVGLAIARMLGHITFLSEERMREKFGRSLRHGGEIRYDLASQFSVETYLDYKSSQFVEQFDANSYLYLTRAMDLFDLGHKRGGVEAAMARASARFMLISFSDDWLFTAGESLGIVSALVKAQRPCTYLNVPSHYGHDAFLLPNPLQEAGVAAFIERLYAECTGGRGGLDRMADGEIAEDEKRRLDLERIDTLVDPGESVLDLGCGDGMFLAHLRARAAERVQGLDVDPEQVVNAVRNGVHAVQADLDRPLTFLPDKSFDVVLLSRTLQVVRHPSVVLQELLRIGRRCIVTFPNFGYWQNRHKIAWFGRVPLSRNLPYRWSETPNLHHLAMKDFEDWCREQRVRVEQRIAMDYRSERELRLLPNLRATDAIYVISRD